MDVSVEWHSGKDDDPQERQFETWEEAVAFATDLVKNDKEVMTVAVVYSSLVG